MTRARPLPLALLFLVVIACAGVARGDDGAAGRLEQATLERRVFRHVLVGKIRFPSERLTWVLYHGTKRARLELFCQEGDKRQSAGITLDGKENDEAYWQAPAAVHYAGARASERPLTYELKLEPGGSSTGGPCGGPPATLTLVCRPTKVQAQVPGAVLVPGTRQSDERITPARWKPAARHAIAGLTCQFGDADRQRWPAASFSTKWPLVFASSAAATSPGLEWADENSDMMVQEGAYREILPPP